MKRVIPWAILSLMVLASPLLYAAPSQSWMQIVSHALRQGTFPVNAWMVAGSSATTTIQVDRLRGCEGFIMRLENPGADNVLVAAGIALGAGRPSVYVVSDRKQLPWFLREADETYPGQVAIIKASDPLVGKLSGRAPIPSGLHYDTFIGCQMSGLTPAQYKEARDHLHAIDIALRASLDSPDNFCEPLRSTPTKQKDTPREALKRDIAAVGRSSRALFYVYDSTPRPSGMWVEAGAALAAGRPVTILTPSLDAIPPGLREPMAGVTVRLYKDHAALLAGLRKDPAALLR